jgi:RHS repeat-associated protein
MGIARFDVVPAGVRITKALLLAIIVAFAAMPFATPARADWFTSGSGTNHGGDWDGAARESMMNTYGIYVLLQDGVDSGVTFNNHNEAVQAHHCGVFRDRPPSSNVLCGLADQTCDSGQIATAGGCRTSAVAYQGCNQCRPKPNPVRGEPMNVVSGNLFETVTDFSTAGVDALTAIRYYNSDLAYLNSGPTGQMSRFGGGWRSEYDLTLTSTVSGYVDVALPNGNPIRFILVGSTYQAAYYDGSSWTTGRTDVDVRLTTDGTYWYVTDQNDTVYKYNLAGQYISVKYRDGYERTLTYNGSGQNTVVSDTFGRQITFTYNAKGLVDTMTDSDGKVIQYDYVDRALGPMPSAPGYPGLWALSTVEYPDASPSVHPTIKYLYEETDVERRFALTGITDENGNRYATWTYDSDGKVTSSQLAGTVDLTSVSYNLVGNTRTVTNALGKQDIYNLSSAQGILQIDSIAGQASTHTAAATTSYLYDGNEYVSQVTDGNGNVTKYTHNAVGQETSRTEGYGSPVARTTTTTWNSTWREPDQIVQPNVTTNFTYDGSGRLSQLAETDTTTQTVPYVTNGQTRTWAFTYSAAGLLATVDGPISGSGDTTTYGYNASGFVNSITDVLGHVTSISSINGRGLPLTSVDPNSVTTNYTYDERGRILSVTVNPGASQAQTSFTYDLAGNLTVVTRPDGSTLTYGYDNSHRITSVTNNLGESITYTLDDLGDRTATVVRSAGSTIVNQQTATFDELGRMMASIGASSQTTSYTYDQNNNEVSSTDPRSKLYGYAFDALNRLYQQTDPDSFTTTTAFDAQNDVTSVTDARSLVTTYVRDGFGDAIRQVSPDSGTTDFWYDANGVVTKSIDARGVETDFTNDAAGRTLTKTFPASSAENVTYGYDATAGSNKGVGRLTSITDQSGSTAYVYNALGQTISDTRVISGNSYATSYTYDAAGNVLTITYPSGRIVTYTRDSFGQISGITTKQNSGASPVTVASSITHEPFGPAATLTYGNGLALTRTFDQDYELTGISSVSGGTTIQNLTNVFDPAGNITSITDGLTPARSQTMTYDDLNRISTASGVYGSQSYSYDGVGNRTAVPSASQTYTYAATANQIRGITNVTAPATASGTYLFNALHQRVQKVSGGVTTQFGHDSAGRLLEEADGSGTAQKEYIWLDSLPVGLVDDTGMAPALDFVHADQIGAPQKVADGSLNVVWDGVFDPFGNPATGASLALTNLRFPGQYADSEVSLNQNWYRDYDPTTGRYDQTDPLGLFVGTDTYTYADSNPLIWIDPWGLCWIYYQTTGRLEHVLMSSDSTIIDYSSGSGYSGVGAGLNNPAMQSVPNVGPIPQGAYRIGPSYDSPHMGRSTMNLRPSATTNTFGRSLFRIHGDNQQRNNTASEGCIIESASVRQRIANSGDNCLIVKP